MSVRVRRIRLSVGTCPAIPAECGDVFGDVGLFSGFFFNFGLVPARVL